MKAPQHIRSSLLEPGFYHKEGSLEAKIRVSSRGCFRIHGKSNHKYNGGVWADGTHQRERDVESNVKE